jgi:transportin-3
LHFLLYLLEFGPDVFFTSSAFPAAFEAAMAALTVIHSDIIFAAVDLFRNILTHNCLAPPSGSPPPPKFPVYAAAISAVVEAAGFQFLSYVLVGLIGDFPEDATSAVVTIFRSIAVGWSSQLLSWLPLLVQQLPPTSVPSQAKAQFLADVNRYASFFPLRSNANLKPAQRCHRSGVRQSQICDYRTSQGITKSNRSATSWRH